MRCFRIPDEEALRKAGFRGPGEYKVNKPTIKRDNQVKQRAFELWQQHGSREGYQAEFWAQAERELENEGNTIGTTANAESAKSGSGSDGPG
jgi:hypothetical protein